MPTRTWDQSTRDLRLARHSTDQTYVHSLGGCVWRGFLTRLRTFDWTPTDAPPASARQADLLRRAPRAASYGQRPPVARGRHRRRRGAAPPSSSFAGLTARV